MSDPPEDTPVASGGGERAPGWYPDPDGSGWRRYWDGNAWAPVTPEQLAEREREGGDGADGGSERPSRGRIVARVVVSLVVIAAAIVIAAVASNSSSSKHTANSSHSTSAHTSSGSTTSHTSTSTTPTAVTAAAITALTSGYASAINHRNLPALTALFAPSLVRRGGNGQPQNLAKALALYKAQFAAEANPQFKLSGLHVAPGTGQGSAGGRFGLNQNGQRSRGTIAFHMTQMGPRLLIDQLVLRNH